MKIVFAGGKSQNRKYSKKISVDFDKKTYNTNYYAIANMDLEFKSGSDVDNFIMLLELNGYKEESGNKSEKYTSYSAKSNKLRLNETSRKYLKFNLDEDEAERIAKSVNNDLTLTKLYSDGYDFWENDTAFLSKDDLYDLMNEAYRLGLEHGIERKVV